jgi:hypothetical protein
MNNTVLYCNPSTVLSGGGVKTDLTTRCVPTVAWLYCDPLGIFPILLSYNLELKWIFVGFVSFDLHDMPTTLKTQNILNCEKKLDITIHPSKVNTL